jgi:hypothetical protein
MIFSEKFGWISPQMRFGEAACCVFVCALWPSSAVSKRGEARPARRRGDFRCAVYTLSE